MKPKHWSLLAFVLCAFVPAAPSRGDITFGGQARAFAMGGAGIAILDRSDRTTPLNPASLALLNRRVKLRLPSIGLRASGISLQAAIDHLFTHPSQNDAVSLARDFGTRQSDFGVSLAWGMRFGHMDLDADGVATAHVIPNAALITWAKTANGDVQKLTGAERADLLAAAVYSLPQIGLAERISPPGSPVRTEAGVRIKLARAVYTHYIADANNIAHNTAAAPAPELNGGTTITQDGLGMDFGMLIHPAHNYGFSGAVVVTNLVDPRFIITGTDASGAPTKYELQPRSVSAGSAYTSGKIVLAYDLVDIGRAYGPLQHRLGCEYRTRGVALRAGYSSVRGFTGGFGWGFLDFAFGARAPLEVTQSLRF